VDIKRKTCDIETWKKRLFLDISSTNIDTLVPSLFQCVETRSTEVFWLLSQPLPYLHFNFFVVSDMFSTVLDPLSGPLYTTNTSHLKQETYFVNILSTEFFAHKRKTHNRTLLLGSTLLKHGRHFDY
jgi:hypothetical protein